MEVLPVLMRLPWAEQGCTRAGCTTACSFASDPQSRGGGSDFVKVRSARLTNHASHISSHKSCPNSRSASLPSFKTVAAGEGRVHDGTPLTLGHWAHLVRPVSLCSPDRCAFDPLFGPFYWEDCSPRPRWPNRGAPSPASVSFGSTPRRERRRWGVPSRPRPTAT